jgi:hypothetical protein
MFYNFQLHKLRSTNQPGDNPYEHGQVKSADRQTPAGRS